MHCGARCSDQEIAAELQVPNYQGGLTDGTKQTTFLRSLAVGAAMAMTAAQSGEVRKNGLQLYTIRDLLKSDFEGTLKKVDFA
jgi:hypothetical protein